MKNLDAEIFRHPLAKQESYPGCYTKSERDKMIGIFDTLVNSICETSLQKTS